MFTIDGKKMLPLLILQILREETDAEHAILQQDIVQKLKARYGVECTRKTVASNILDLQKLDYDIDQGTAGYRLMSREFEPSELRLLIDSVLFSKSLSHQRAQELITKLSKQGSKYFAPKVGHIYSLRGLQHTRNKQVLLTLDVLDDAIAAHKKVRFTYNTYGTDLHLHPRRNKLYVVNPYQIVASNGRYYLVCNYDAYDTVAHYRIELITDIALLDEPAKPMSQVKGLENGLNLPKHMAEHIYMFSGPTVPVVLRTRVQYIGDLVDWFGHDIEITAHSGDEIEVFLRCNESAMLYWALQYGRSVEVLKPATLRAQIREAIAEMWEKYKD